MTQALTGTPRARAFSEDQADAWARSDEVVSLMLRKQWRPRLELELAAKWGCSERSAKAALTRALYFLARIGERDRVLAEVDEYLQGWVRESSQDRVPAARLLLERLGALRLKHEVSVNVTAMSPAELRAELRDSIRNPDETLLETLAEPGMIEGLNAMVFQRRKMLVETTGEQADE